MGKSADLPPFKNFITSTTLFYLLPLPGEMIQFDEHICFKWVGEKPPTSNQFLFDFVTQFPLPKWWEKKGSWNLTKRQLLLPNRKIAAAQRFCSQFYKPEKENLGVSQKCHRHSKLLRFSLTGWCSVRSKWAKDDHFHYQMTSKWAIGWWLSISQLVLSLKKSTIFWCFRLWDIPTSHLRSLVCNDWCLVQYDIPVPCPCLLLLGLDPGKSFRTYKRILTNGGWDPKFQW